MKFEQSHPPRGSAVLVLIVLLGLMVALAAANHRTVRELGRQLAAIEKQQTRRLTSSSTNTPPQP
jgi:hypothetical protein